MDAQLALSPDGTKVLANPYVGVLEGERYILVEHEPHGQLRGPLDNLDGVVVVADEDDRLGSLEMEVLPHYGRLEVMRGDLQRPPWASRDLTWRGLMLCPISSYEFVQLFARLEAAR